MTKPTDIVLGPDGLPSAISITDEAAVELIEFAIAEQKVNEAPERDEEHPERGGNVSDQLLPEIPEQAEQAELILLTALNRLRAMGYAVEAKADEGRIVLIHELYPAWRGKVLPPFPPRTPATERTP